MDDEAGEELAFTEAGRKTMKLDGVSQFRLFVWDSGDDDKPLTHEFTSGNPERALRLTMRRHLLSEADMTGEMNDGLCLFSPLWVTVL